MILTNKTGLILILILVSCNPPKAIKEIASLNEGELINKHFFFSVPYLITSDSAAVIEVTINGKRKRFMVDTGAPLAISKSLQKELQLPIAVKTFTVDANGDTTGVEIVRVPTIFINNLQFKGIPALVLDLDQALFACDSIDGLIGSNLLRLLVIQFNKAEKKIYFADHIDSFKLHENSTSTAMQVSKSQGDPVITLSINGFVNDSTLYDTGDKTLYTISKFQFDIFNNKHRFDSKIIASGTGVGAQGIVAKNTDALPTFVFKIDSLFLGKTSIKDVYSEPNYSTGSRMGRGLWDYGVITMDYPQKKFYFTPNQQDLKVETLSHFGFKYQEREGRLLITVVWNNTEAFFCGLRPGFEIIQFGNFIPHTVSKCEWVDYCKKEAESPHISIKYLNNKGETKQCSLIKITFP